MIGALRIRLAHFVLRLLRIKVDMKITPNGRYMLRSDALRMVKLIDIAPNERLRRMAIDTFVKLLTNDDHHE